MLPSSKRAKPCCFLQRFQVQPGLAMRIIKVYGGNTITVLRANPYQMVRDIPGVGFRTADRIAQSMGTAVTDSNRLRRTFLCAADVAGASGHVFLPRDKLLEAAQGCLQAPQEELENELAVLVIKGELRQEEREDCTAVYHHSHAGGGKRGRHAAGAASARAAEKTIRAEDGELDSFEDERGIRALRRPAPRHQNGGDLARRGHHRRAGNGQNHCD